MRGDDSLRLVDQLTALVERLERLTERLERLERQPQHESPRDAGSIAISTAEYMVMSSAPGITPPMFRETVARWYTEWCQPGGSRPKPTSDVEIASLRYLTRESGTNPNEPARFVLRDASQVSEFVRFSRTGENVGLVLPDPDAHFTTVVSYLFPSVSRESFDHTEQLGALQPLSVRRRANLDWVSGEND